MLKSQPQKTKLKKRRTAAVGILLSGLGRIAAGLHSYGALPDEPKPLRMPDLLPTLPLHRVSDSVAPPASQVRVDCMNVETLFMPVILGKQMQDSGPRGSISCKALATLTQLIFCTGKIFRLTRNVIQSYTMFHSSYHKHLLQNL
jgi:hypothetical protein